eukprot:4326122-Amphidinium_carterae.1
MKAHARKLCPSHGLGVVYKRLYKKQDRVGSIKPLGMTLMFLCAANEFAWSCAGVVHSAALAPTVLGKALSAWSTAKTAVSFRLICPTDAFGAELPFAAATSLASDKASAPTAVTSTSPLLATTNLQ